MTDVTHLIFCFYNFDWNLEIFNSHISCTFTQRSMFLNKIKLALRFVNLGIEATYLKDNCWATYRNIREESLIHNHQTLQTQQYLYRVIFVWIFADEGHGRKFGSVWMCCQRLSNRLLRWVASILRLLIFQFGPSIVISKIYHNTKT